MMASTTGAHPSSKAAYRRKDRVDKNERTVDWTHWPDPKCQYDEMDEQSLLCSHPDLEDGSLIAWGLKLSEQATGDKVEIDVLYGTGTDLSKSCEAETFVEWSDIVTEWEPCTDPKDDNLLRIANVRLSS